MMRKEFCCTVNNQGNVIAKYGNDEFIVKLTAPLVQRAVVTLVNGITSTTRDNDVAYGKRMLELMYNLADGTWTGRASGKRNAVAGWQIFQRIASLKGVTLSDDEAADKWGAKSADDQKAWIIKSGNLWQVAKKALEAELAGQGEAELDF